MENDLSISPVGSMYDVIFSKSDSAIWKVGWEECTDLTDKVFIKQEALSCEFLVKKRK